MRMGMKTARSAKAAALAALGAALIQAAPPTCAGPDSSPSARSAARLKQNPPRNWLRHYLPDDRYKLGSTWQVVSTETDTLYHRPSCPRMLAQPAGIVLGFPSAAEGLEAGYKACTTCRPAYTSFFRAVPTRPTTQRRMPEAEVVEDDAPLTEAERQQEAAYNRATAQFLVDLAEWQRQRRELPRRRRALLAKVFLTPIDREEIRRIDEALSEPIPTPPVAPPGLGRRNAAALLRMYRKASAPGR